MSLLACGFGTERLRRSTQYKKNTSSNCLQRKTAFHGPYVITVAPLLNQALCRRVTFDDFTIVITSLPLGPIVLAGASIGVLGVLFENTLSTLYQKRRPAVPSEDELCYYCSGFGTVRCEICSSTGVVNITGTSFQRTCPVCKGHKRECCKRCGGTGKSGKKKQKQPPPLL